MFIMRLRCKTNANFHKDKIFYLANSFESNIFFFLRIFSQINNEVLQKIDPYTTFVPNFKMMYLSEFVR